MDSADNARLQNAVIRFGGVKDLATLEAIVTEQLGEEYHMYRKLWNSTTRSSTFEYPLHIDFELNDNCNQRCIMCPRNEQMHPNTAYPINTNKYLPLEIFKRVIDESSMYGMKSINLGAFAEPFINPNFKSMILHAKSSGILDIRVITNGLLLDEYIEFLLDTEVTNLFISVDAANESTYEKIRGKGFNRVIENIMKLVNARNSRNSIFPIIRVSFVALSVNNNELDDFIKKWQGLVDFIDVQPGEDLSHSISSKLSSEKRFDCIAPWQRISVLSSGDILPCCSFYGRYLPIGNIDVCTIKQAWDSEIMRSLRDRLLSDQESVCDTCQRSLLPQ
jgi:radical SAM protein with 4Fe4S-binding SPASM domain